MCLSSRMVDTSFSFLADLKSFVEIHSSLFQKSLLGLLSNLENIEFLS